MGIFLEISSMLNTFLRHLVRAQGLNLSMIWLLWLLQKIIILTIARASLWKAIWDLIFMEVDTIKICRNTELLKWSYTYQASKVIFFFSHFQCELHHKASFWQVYRSEAQSQDHSFFSCAGSGRANRGTQIPWVDGLGCLLKSWKSLWRTCEHGSPGCMSDSLGTAGGDVMAVQTSGINHLRGSHVLIPPGPTECLSSVAGPTLGMHLRSAQLSYEAKQMPSPKVTQRALPTAILSHSFWISVLCHDFPPFLSYLWGYTLFCHILQRCRDFPLCLTTTECWLNCVRKFSVSKGLCDVHPWAVRLSIS